MQLGDFDWNALINTASNYALQKQQQDQQIKLAQEQLDAQVALKNAQIAQQQALAARAATGAATPPYPGMPAVPGASMLPTALRPYAPYLLIGGVAALALLAKLVIHK